LTHGTRQKIIWLSARKAIILFFFEKTLIHHQLRKPTSSLRIVLGARAEASLLATQKNSQLSLNQIDCLQKLVIGHFRKFLIRDDALRWRSRTYVKSISKLGHNFLTLQEHTSLESSEEVAGEN